MKLTHEEVIALYLVSNPTDIVVINSIEYWFTVQSGFMMEDIPCRWLETAWSSFLFKLEQKVHNDKEGLLY